MTREIITFAPEAFLPAARAAFAKACGFQAGNDRHRRMSELAEQVLEDGIDSLRPTAVVSAFDSDALVGDTIRAGGFSFHCEAFAQFDPKHVRRIYAFMLAVHNIKPKQEGISAAVFADMWGTIFCDAAIAALTEMLRGSTIIYPGFFGFSLSNILLFSKLLDGEGIGIQVREPGYTMLPVKSCCGFLFESTDPLPVPETACRDCIANKHWCIMCKNNEKREPGNEPLILI